MASDADTKLKPGRVPRWVDGVWLALLAVYIVAGASIVPFHGDESTLIYMGRDYHYLFVEGDPSKVLYDEEWAERPDEQWLRLINGTVSKTIYGWLAASSGYAVDDLNGQWDWSRHYNFNRADNRIPAADLLQLARLASAIQLALATALFFQFTRITLGRPTAFLASALFALHPNVLINGRRAMMEGSHLLGLMLALLAGAWLLRERRWWTYALLGVCMGFAVAAKHPNVIVCGAVFVAGLIITLRSIARSRNSSEWKSRNALLGLIVAGLLSLVTFLLLNPAWWSAPLELPPVVLSLRENLLEAQVDAHDGYDGLAEQARGFFDYVFVGQPQYFEARNWSSFRTITAEIENYERSGLAGLQIGGTSVFGLICAALAGFGVLDMFRSRNLSSDSRLLIYIWIGSSVLFTLLLTPLPWARYYLALLPALALTVSHALIVIFDALWKRFNSPPDGIAVLA